MHDWFKGKMELPYIAAVGKAVPPHVITQRESQELSRSLFRQAFPDIDRYLGIFANTGIQKRHFCVPPEWFAADHSFADKNRLYIEAACQLGAEAIQTCLQQAGLTPQEVDALIFVSSTGIATPCIDAHLINLLDFPEQLKRIPLWGLGCAGGAMGLSRAFEYAKAYPSAVVLLLSVELCGLTFIRSDMSKSNLIATSLFSDGAAAVLVAGDERAAEHGWTSSPAIVDTVTTTWRESLDVMGWDVTDQGLKVLFSRDIPTLIGEKVRTNVQKFLQRHQLALPDIRHYILHPGGTKVLQAYEETLGLTSADTAESRHVLHEYGNMSSATVLFVLEKVLEQPWTEGEKGLMMALGPGFSSEMLLLEKEA